MSCCMGFFKKKRGKSLPPNGTQVKQDKKPVVTDIKSFNASLPNLDILDESKSQKQNRVSEEDETLNEIYPAPLSFRETNRSPEPESEARTRTWEQETDALKSFDSQLKKELKQNIPKSARSEKSQREKASEIRLEDIQKLTSDFNVDKSEMEKLKSENKNLLTEVGKLRSEMLDREVKAKEENDFLISTVHKTLAKDTRTDKERESLIKIFVSKQTEKNEKLIKEQTNLIENLKLKCFNYENEIKELVENRSESILNRQVNELNHEVSLLRNLVFRLNVELSDYQAKNPTPAMISALKKIDISSIPSRGSIPIWLVNSKYLSPLMAAYDDKINERNDKIKFYKNKIDDLTQKMAEILEENTQLHSKLERMSLNSNKNDPEDLEIRKQIRHHAMLVLEENKALNDQLDFQQDKLIESQRHTIIEIGNLSKRIIVSESEKTDLRNHIETLKFNYDELTKKFNDCLAEAQRRVKLQDHLSQTSELKKQLEESDIYHKLESEQHLKKIENLEYEKKDLTIKNKNLLTENRKLLAENKVMDKALNDGIGRKMQGQLKEMEKCLEVAEIREKTLLTKISKLDDEINQLKQEKETYEKMFKTSQTEFKKFENKQLEENLKMGKVENKFEEYKQKTNEKLANLNDRLKQKESEFLLVKLECDKKITDLLNLLHKKQDQIDDLIQEKRQMECELEMVWQSTSAENRRLKETLLNNLRGTKNLINDDTGFNSSYHKLLIED